MVCVECNTNVDHQLRKGMCNKCYNRQYYIVNRDRLLGYSKKWYKNNTERKKEYDREYHPKKPRSEWGKREKFSGPCSECGLISEKTRYIHGLCRSCHRKKEYAKKNPKITMYCNKCGKKLERKYTKFDACVLCRNKDRYKNDKKYRNKISKQAKKYRESENGKIQCRINVIRRRGRIAKVKSTLTQDEWEHICKTYNYRCAYCGKKTKLEMDHVVPISLGGPTTKENILPACRSCNSSKNNKVAIDILSQTVNTNNF